MTTTPTTKASAATVGITPMMQVMNDGAGSPNYAYAHDNLTYLYTSIPYQYYKDNTLGVELMHNYITGTNAFVDL
ncbi:hypothetical protein [Lactococcus sp. dk101]|uniref:hypothetical protein n=1 Tax=Lactococcus sp. dk101 TaxID=2662430 RepID=UPI001295C494|nr:hypothetical protein [Lactococcus sp. dk101]